MENRVQGGRKGMNRQVAFCAMMIGTISLGPIHKWLFFIPPSAGLEILQYIPACPVECEAYSSGVVKILIFPRSKCGIFDLALQKLSHFWIDTH